MKTRTIVLLIVLAVIIGAISYLESTKVQLPPIPQPAVTEQMDGPKPLEEIAKVEMPEEMSEEEKARIAEKERKYRLAPELAGIVGYLNAEEGLQISDFRGKVVLIDFWTYTCINCIRTLPHLTAWDERYKDKGLVIIGVHTPEFEFEKEAENVRTAMQKGGIKYRVVQDNDYVTWRAFRNRYWPRKYLIDQDGFIRFDHIGEGAYDTTERKIQELLAEIGEEVTEMGTTGIADITPTTINTPELYAGFSFAFIRGQDIGNIGGLQAGKTATYTLPSKLKNDRMYLEGEWRSSEDSLEARQDDAAIVLSFRAKKVNIVAEPLDGVIEMEVFINDEYLSEDQAGSDVVHEDGRAFIVVDKAELYNVISGPYERNTLKLVVDKGFSFNAFTFG